MIGRSLDPYSLFMFPFLSVTYHFVFCINLGTNVCFVLIDSCFVHTCHLNRYVSVYFIVVNSVY